MRWGVGGSVYTVYLCPQGLPLSIWSCGWMILLHKVISDLELPSFAVIVLEW